jgi:hypothetical protein
MAGLTGEAFRARERGIRSRSPAERMSRGVDRVQLSRDLSMLGNSRDTSTVDIDVEFVPVTT